MDGTKSAAQAAYEVTGAGWPKWVYGIGIAMGTGCLGLTYCMGVSPIFLSIVVGVEAIAMVECWRSYNALVRYIFPLYQEASYLRDRLEEEQKTLRYMTEQLNSLRTVLEELERR